MFREMIRKNRAIPAEECLELLKSTKRGVLSVLGDDDYPYGMPMNHWYNEADGAIYFHSGNVGHRLEAIKAHDKVSFCVMDDGERHDGEWALNFRSVIVFGRISIVEDPDTVAEFTRQLSYKFTQDEAYIQKEIEQHLHRTILLRLKPEHICGKRVNES
ncbi:MAG: pyridoxamine 5'-phosphate oxidase family protein [Ruminococcaceae bacterium]|nr:pyridoxamine 5'-phosphate oxidase family protein [Oscillospiraceae bacterium]